MSLRVSCPYCNTAFALPEVPPSGRAACPRCGDAFAVKAAAEENDPGEPGSVRTRVVTDPGPPTPGPPPTTPRARFRNLFLVAGCAGLLGLGIGLLVHHF